jgi:cbb3-type cytochrome oxidase subunit 1
VLTTYVRGFIRASLVWLAIGVMIGVAMAYWPAGHIVYRPAHAHANLLGFVNMFIFGVAYHVLPRFVGRPLPSERMATWHLWIANLGLGLLVSGWLAGPALFIVNAWRITGQRSNVELTRPSGR